MDSIKKILLLVSAALFTVSATLFFVSYKITNTSRPATEENLAIEEASYIAGKNKMDLNALVKVHPVYKTYHYRYCSDFGISEYNSTDIKLIDALSNGYCACPSCKPERNNFKVYHKVDNGNDVF